MNGLGSMVATSPAYMFKVDSFNRKLACMKVFSKRDDILVNQCFTPFFSIEFHLYLHRSVPFTLLRVYLRYITTKSLEKAAISLSCHSLSPWLACEHSG